MKYCIDHTDKILAVLLLSAAGSVSSGFAAVETSTDETSGLPQEVVELMAAYCIFDTVIKNESDDALGYRVADWCYVTANGQAHPAKTKTQWLKEWQDMGVVFRWSLLPDGQQFAPGDWSQGFTTLPLAPGTWHNIHTQLPVDTTG